jgi:hypothetical protein
MHGYDYYLQQAAKFRRLADHTDPETRESLLTLAEGYETEGKRLQQAEPVEQPGPRLEH